MFHEKFKSTSFSVIQTRLSTAFFAELMRFHQTRITSYFELRSFSISINEKSNRSNFATSNSSHEFFINRFLAFVLHMKITLIFNKKFVDSRFMCQSTEIEVNSLENKNVVFFNFFRKCRHCKQFFIFKNLFYKHISHCNKNIKELKHVKKLNDS